MQPSLIILAAGMGSRYGSLKQLDGVGPKGETIIDYLVYDAIKAGFGKVVFVIRESFADEFKTKVTQKFQDKVKVDFAYQAVNTPIEGIEKLPERTKPWGTAHAVLVARDKINEPFAVANADDFYGRDAFIQLGKYLQEGIDDSNYSMVGYQLSKTLSDNGTVSRGVCERDENEYLTTVIEQTKIGKEENKIYFYEESEKQELLPDNLVSMNLWGFHPSIFKHMNEQFIEFVNENSNEPKAEFFIPLVSNRLINNNTVKIKVIPTNSDWFGVTYKEDKVIIQEAILAMIDKGIYPAKLWA